MKIKTKINWKIVVRMRQLLMTQNEVENDIIGGVHFNWNHYQNVIQARAEKLKI